MGNRLAGLLRGLWFVVVVVVTCVVISVPVFIGIFLGLTDRVVPPGFMAWFSCWFWSGGVVAEVRGREHLDSLHGSPAFLAGNHQSALDIPLLIIACRGRVRFLAKKSLFWVPIVGWVMKFSGFPAIDRRSARRTYPALEAAIAKMKNGRNYWIVFPEGTRSPDANLLPYHRGTFNFARQAGVPLVPFALDRTAACLPKGRLLPKPGRVVVVFGKPIPASELARMTPDELMGQARAFTAATLASLRAPASPDNAAPAAQ